MHRHENRIKKRALAALLLAIVVMLPMQPLWSAATWRTHFAYSDVAQIAVTDVEVFGLSDGSLYSVNKQTEALRLWDLSSGLHSTDVCCIGYEEESGVLVILYKNGKVDLGTLSGSPLKGERKDPTRKSSQEGRNHKSPPGFHVLKGEGGVEARETITYVGDLYLEDMTASKQANCVAFHGARSNNQGSRLAYIGMPFGIMTFDLQKREFPNTYYIGSEAGEVNVQTIFFSGDTIYAASDSLLYSAVIDSNLVDYRVWTCAPLPTSGRVYEQWMSVRSQTYQDGAYTWRAAGAQGIERTGMGGAIYYKPDGPRQQPVPHDLPGRQAVRGAGCALGGAVMERRTGVVPAGRQVVPHHERVYRVADRCACV